MNASRVVVGVDGSPLARTAVLQAAHLAATRHLSLRILHAFAPDLPMLGFGEIGDRTLVTEHGRTLLRRAAALAHAAHPGLEVTTSLTDGFASQALISASRRAELVVVGAVGHSIQSRASLGAVAMQVLTHASSPVLVVGHESSASPAPGSRVLVGVDGSPCSLEALRAAIHEAAVLDGVVEVVHAWQARGTQDPTLASTSSWEDYTAEIQRRVDGVVAAGRDRHPDPKVEVNVVRQDPVRALTSRSAAAALVVVGSRGSGGFEGLHVGSTTLRLVGAAACPTLVIR